MSGENHGEFVVPGWLAPVAAALGSVAVAVTTIAPPHTVAHQVAQVVAQAVGVFGAVSAGWRKRS